MMAIAKKAETKETIEKEAVTAVTEKETVKKAAPSNAETKEPEKKEPAKREPVKRTAAKKEPVKKAAPAKKTTAKEVKAKVYIQYDSKEVLAEALVEEAKKAYVKAGNKAADIKTIDVYVKPEENAAYFAVNGEGSEERKIVL